MWYTIRTKNGKWALQARTGTHEHTISRTIKPHTPEFQDLGFKEEMSEQEARERCKQVSQEVELKRISERRHRADTRRKELDLIESVWLPRAWVREFEDGYLKLLGKRKDRWLIAKALIAKLELGPHEWHWQPETLYNLFIKRADSLDYARRLLKLINKWGAFYCFKAGKSFLPVDPPQGAHKRTLRATYYKTKPDRSTKIISLEDLPLLKVKFSEKQFNSIRLMLWFGLRPRELKQILNGNGDKNAVDLSQWFVQTDDARFKFVLHVFQNKLLDAGIEPRLCWKAIPAVEPEQIECLSILQSDPPLIASLGTRGVRELGSERSLRKSFSAIMSMRGYSENCVSRWLGHVGSSTLRRSYETKQIAFYEPPYKKVG